MQLRGWRDRTGSVWIEWAIQGDASSKPSAVPLRMNRVRRGPARSLPFAVRIRLGRLRPIILAGTTGKPLASQQAGERLATLRNEAREDGNGPLSAATIWFACIGRPIAGNEGASPPWLPDSACRDFEWAKSLPKPKEEGRRPRRGQHRAAGNWDASRCGIQAAGCACELLPSASPVSGSAPRSPVAASDAVLGRFKLRRRTRRNDSRGIPVSHARPRTADCGSPVFGRCRAASC